MPKQLAECRTVQDMYSVYADFFQTAMTDYQSEFEQMSKLGKSIAGETAQAVQTRLEEMHGPPGRTAEARWRPRSAPT